MNDDRILIRRVGPLRGEVVIPGAKNSVLKLMAATLLADALERGLSLVGGAKVTSAGMLPTPALAWLAAVSGYPAAMITASHNPWQDNGVKIFAPGGLKLADEVERSIEAAIAHPVAPGLPIPGSQQNNPRVVVRWEGGQFSYDRR